MCAPGPRRKEQWPHKRLTQTCPWVSRSLWWRGWPAPGLGALKVAVCAWDPLKEVTFIFIISTIVWPQVNNREGTQPQPLTENWIKDLLSMTLPIRTRFSFPPSQSHPSRSFRSLLSSSVGRQTDWKTLSQKNNQSDLWDHSLVYLNETVSQVVQGHPRQMGHGGEFWQNELEKGLANHFSILALRTPWTVWKGKKIGHWKMNSSGHWVPNMLLGISGEITSKRMKSWSQSKNNTQLCIWLVMEVKSDAIKSNNASRNLEC